MAALFLFGAMAGGGAAGATEAPAAAPSRTSTPELLEPHLVDIGGRKLNLVCAGEGSPTLVFDMGMGDSILTWQPIAHRAEALTRACFYERASYGYSDPSPRPMTADNITDDLHALLQAAGVTGPVVLVGQSIGGLYATLYADRRLDEVAGLVLIDPSVADIDLPKGEWRVKAKAELDATLAQIKHCGDLARAGALTQADPHGCFSFRPGRTPDEKAYLTAYFSRPSYYEGLRSEEMNALLVDGVVEDWAEERRVARKFGDLPMVVLTARKPPQADAVSAERWSEWKTAHDRLAARSTRGVSIVVLDADHFIHQDDPDAVMKAIETVVSEAREARRDR